MKLCYHRGKNFGDALNPLIFDHFLPGMFDENTEEIFIGIGSVLGLQKGFPDTKKKIVFSSGYAAGMDSTYGEKPQIDDSYEIYCVRGPKTAKILGLDPALAVADGALLLRYLDIPRPEKAYAFSYMPHVGSEKTYEDWERLCHKAGVHFISPQQDVDTVLREILASEVIIAEAMHGAIAADALRVPWIPVSCYRTVNRFKWEDFCASMELEYKPHALPSVYSKAFLQGIFKAKLRNKAPGFVVKALASVYKGYQSMRKESKWVKELAALKQAPTFLSSDAVWEDRSEKLRKIIGEIALKYGK